ncbi:MAG: nickel-responsive transcriptional regulator NikR [Elusimicrobiales bacterium]|nr:nickel-responsive transcriptional regulator NikR [Elusimicrobiales bacterium]
MKDKLVRFGVSLEGELLRKFDAFIGAEGSCNRSKAIADLIRKEFVSDAFARGGTVAGAITVVFDPRRRETAGRLLALQRAAMAVVISSQRAQLDQDNCLEIIAVKGPGAKVKALADALKSVRGVKHSTFSVTTPGK